MSGTNHLRPDDWHLTFRAEGAGPPVEIRVRRLLKSALRRHGLRCVSVADLKALAVETTPASTSDIPKPGDCEERAPGGVALKAT